VLIIVLVIATTIMGKLQVFVFAVGTFIHCSVANALPPSASPSTPATWLIERYQKFLTHSKASTCGMHPSCSEYAREAYSEVPLWNASLATADRLNRCGHDNLQYDYADVSGVLKKLDPPPGSTNVSIPRISSNTAPIHPVDVHLASMKKGLSEDAMALDFARYLHGSGMHEEALVEYLRFLRQYPDSKLVSSAHISVMHLHYEVGDYLMAVRGAEQAMQAEQISVEDIPELKFWVSAAYARLDNPEMARQSLPRNEAGPELAARAKLLEGYTYAQQEDWTRAAVAFQEYGLVTHDEARVNDLTDVSRQALARRRKSPGVAGVLGIVPGLGYLYSGYPESAVSALIINSLLVSASYQAFKDGNEPLGALLGVIGIGWYAGSIYGSVSAAERRNEKDLRDTLLELKVGFRF